MRSYLPLIPKDSTTHMHGLAVYVREGLPFTRDFLIMFLQILTHFFFHHRSISSLCPASDSISSNIDQVLLIDPSANMFIIGDFNVHHKDRLTQTGYLKRPYSDG